jgi:hypothetical protein
VNPKSHAESLPQVGRVGNEFFTANLTIHTFALAPPTFESIDGLKILLAGLAAVTTGSKSTAKKTVNSRLCPQ